MIIFFGTKSKYKVVFMGYRLHTSLPETSSRIFNTQHRRLWMKSPVFISISCMNCWLLLCIYNLICFDDVSYLCHYVMMIFPQRCFCQRTAIKTDY
jgi:hypothetical protein